MKTNVLELINELNKKNKLERVLTFVISLYVSALIFNLFFEPQNIMTGGITSFALLIKYFTKIETSIIVFITSIVLLILCYIFLGIKMVKRSILGTILYAAFIKITIPVANLIDLGHLDTLLSVIYGAIILGFCNGFILKSGYLSGGFQVLYKMFHKIFKISIGNASMIINGTIIALGLVTFGISNTFYAIITIFITNFITDRVLLGVSESKNFYIITDKEKEIREYLINDVHSNFTLVDVKGGYTKKNKSMLVCAIPTKNYPRVKEIIYEIDKDAFFLITDTYERSRKRY